MLGKLASRSAVIIAAAVVVMVVVFVSLYYESGVENTVTQDTSTATQNRSAPTVTATLPPLPAAAAASPSDEPNDAVVATPEPPKEVTYEEAEAAFLERRYGTAVELFAAYTDRKVTNPWGYYMLGLSAWKAGDHERAEAAFARALELDPRHVKSRLNLSRVYLDTGKPLEALDTINDALALDPESNVAYRLKGRVFRQIGQKPQAVEAYRHAIQIDDQDAWSMNNLGLIYLEEELFDKALPPLARAVELQSDNAIFLNNLGMALESTGHYRAAEEAYMSAVAIDVSYEKAAANLDRIAVVLEDPDLESLDLVLVARSFVDEMKSWGEKLAAGGEPESVGTVIGGGLPESTDVIADAVVVSDADSTENGPGQ